MAPALLDNPAQKPRATVALPEGITGREALFLIETLARMKEKRFGRLVVTVSDGRVVDIEVTEKIDRNVFRTFSTSPA